MSKAEKFISDCTRNCSNEIGYCHNKTRNHNHVFYNWLTPNDARKAVEIAREETTDKIKRLLKENYLIKSIEPLRWVSWDKVFNDLKQAMNDE